MGPKAASLVHLSRIGLAVPAGFCITGTVFREHIERNNLTARIKSVVEKLAMDLAIPFGKTKLETKASLLSSLRQAVIEAPLAEEIRRRIENQYRTLGADRVAVRSSGTAEDLPGHSFAGQYDTYLGIANLEDCIEAVKKCWASLWTLRAYEYREKNCFDHLKINMAVIVQSLIAADASGVIFTVDPLISERGSIVIEACFGLGEALVCGKVTPDRFIVGKNNLKIHSCTISEKKIECVLNGNGLIKEQTVPSEKSSTCCLDKKQVTRLAKLARKVETEFGCPQDIEWAICKKNIYFLQSRPITAIGPEKSRQEQQIWSTFCLEEVMPDVVTPVTWSMLQYLGNNLFDPSLRALCINRRDTPVFSLIAGRLYFNASFWTAVILCLPGSCNYDFRKNAGNETGLLDLLDKLENLPKEDLPKIEFNRTRFILKLPLLLIGVIANTPEKGQAILENARKMNKKWQSLDISSLSIEQMADCCMDAIDDFDRLIIAHAPYLFSIMMAFPALEIVCSKWLSDDSSSTSKLLAGLGGMDDAESAMDLWRLALKAHESPDIEMAILAGDCWENTVQKVSELQRGDEFLKSWDEFMERHGHHCRAELELYNQRWYETPDYILGLVRGYLTCLSKTDPLENYRKLANQREQLAAGCRRELKNPIKRLIFNKLLIRSQKGAVFRENIKSEVIRLIVVMRQLLLELGNRFANQGLLAETDDIFFLEFRDILQIAKGRHKLDIRQIVATRRREYKRWQSITPPKVVVGEYDPDSFVPEVVNADVDVLKGWAVSSGVAAGKARVILRADTDEQVLSGEILVAPFTDPGWTPYFLPAAAIVMDQGSLLSHGSIVAREYGIPCVVNVGTATRIIKTGQMIQVDGNHGEVRILK
ncbi:MAG TPA: PEP/pyruvate-binding domain-containing protein [Sedimentisphaerales bacterium]|nr:PEP/pyruvate-binding domain-containing protein [Sedimentisphaerales bacterium]